MLQTFKKLEIRSFNNFFFHQSVLIIFTKTPTWEIKKPRASAFSELMIDPKAENPVKFFFVIHDLNSDFVNLESICDTFMHAA